MLCLQKYNDKLFEDRKDKIIDNIKEIEKCHDWRSFDLNVTVSGINLASLSYEDVSNEGQFCENLAKLSLDYWRDYDFYKSFVFESKFEHKDYIEGLKQLGFECNDGQWRSIRKPDEKTVLGNIFAHCLLTKIHSEMTLNKSHCAYCSIKIGYGLRKCSCDASIDEEEIQNNENENQLRKKMGKKEGTQTSKVISLDSGITVEERDGTNDDSVPEKKEGMKPAPDEWMCGWCQACNEYSFVNCAVCGELPDCGKWYCGQCNGWNIRDDKCCSKCQKQKNIETTLGSRKDNRMCSKCGSLKNDASEECRDCLRRTKNDAPPLKADQWECSKCTLRHTYDAIECGACKLQRHVLGKWTCTKCTLINPLSERVCGACKSINQYLPVKTLRRSNDGDVDVNRAEGEDGAWLCCEQNNSPDTEYCPKCELWRHNPRERGHECMRIHKGKVEAVWICHVCRIVNPLNRKACTRKGCGETRYPRVQCPHCRRISPGKFESCKSCYHKLI